MNKVRQGILTRKVKTNNGRNATTLVCKINLLIKLNHFF